MTNIPEITEGQLNLMKQVCFDPNMSVFSQCAPLPNDPLDAAALMRQAGLDADYLATLGLLKNITANHQEHVEETNKKTGREWQVFEVTAMGRALFQVAVGASN